MKLSCEIVQDLLPLYADELCSPGSRAAVEAHLKECPACRACSGAALSPVEPPEVPDADRAVVKSIRNVRRRWLRSLAAAVLVVPLLLLCLNQATGSGPCFTNPDDILTARRFVKALEAKEWQSAAEMACFREDYDSILDALSLDAEAWGSGFRPLTVEGTALYIPGATDTFDTDTPTARELFGYLYDGNSAMLPLPLWEQAIATDPGAVEREGRQYRINGTLYCAVTTPWGEFMVTDGLTLSSAVEYCRQFFLVPAAVYQEAADALAAQGDPAYTATQKAFGHVAQMSWEEFEVWMTEKYAAELAQLEAMDVSIRLEQLESILRLGPEDFWSVRFRITVTQGTETMDCSLALQVRDGAVEAASISYPSESDRLYKINRCLYPSAHPEY